MLRARSLNIGLALGGAALLVLVAFAVLFVLYSGEKRRVSHDLDASLDVEVDELLRIHRDAGTGALSAELHRRISSVPAAVYLLGDPDRVPEVGNLPTWPSDRDVAPGASFALSSADGLVIGRSYRAVMRRLPDGRALLVAHDTAAHEAALQRVRSALLVAGAIAVAAGIAAGLGVGLVLLRRVRDMNHTIVAILAGDRQRRVPVAEPGNEFDHLAGSFNRLLDENDSLLANMRAVTDEIAHDLRTPLARVRQRLERLARAGPAEPHAEPHNGRVAADTIERTIADLDGVLATFEAVLTLSRLEAGAGRELLAPIDLGFLADVIDLHQARADELGVRIDVAIGAGLRVLGERNLLGQAVSNLIDNALKYGASGGVIGVTAAAVDGMVEIAVSDHGPGIAVADRARVVRRFARLDAARSRPGAGLGLALVQAVAHLHGGELRLTDAVPTPGLRAILRLGAAPPAV